MPYESERLPRATATKYSDSGNVNLARFLHTGVTSEEEQEYTYHRFVWENIEADICHSMVWRHI